MGQTDLKLQYDINEANKKANIHKAASLSIASECLMSNFRSLMLQRKLTANAILIAWDEEQKAVLEDSFDVINQQIKLLLAL